MCIILIYLHMFMYDCENRQGSISDVQFAPTASLECMAPTGDFATPVLMGPFQQGVRHTARQCVLCAPMGSGSRQERCQAESVTSRVETALKQTRNVVPVVIAQHSPGLVTGKYQGNLRIAELITLTHRTNANTHIVQWEK